MMNPEGLEFIREELNMSDSEFRENYLRKNKVYAENNQDYNAGRGIRCGGCKRRIAVENLRQVGGLNYHPRCFKERVLEKMETTMALEGHPLPSETIVMEWLLKTARVMDDGLVRMAETDYDEDVAEAVKEALS